jgi:hypothetical protein
VVCISECDKELETDLYLKISRELKAHPYLTISKILYIPSAIALLLFSISGCSRFISLPGFALLFIFPKACPPIPKFHLFLALSALFSALFYALDLISVPDKRARKYIASILSITAFALLLLSTFLESCLIISLLLALATLFSALFYALDMISVSNRRARKFIASILSITALVPLILSSALFLLLRDIYPCTSIFPILCLFSPVLRPCIALALFSLYMSFSSFVLRLFLDMPEKIGPAEVVGATLTSLAVWFLFFSVPNSSLLFLGIIPCSAVAYAPLCKMRKPMSTIKRTLICCQLLSFAFVFSHCQG